MKWFRIVYLVFVGIAILGATGDYSLAVGVVPPMIWLWPPRRR